MTSYDTDKTRTREMKRMCQRNDKLRAIASDMRGALQSIADGIGDQKTARNALDRLAAREVEGLDVDPADVGIQSRIDELEAKVQQLLNHMRDALDKLEYVDERMQSADFASGSHRPGQVEQSFHDAQCDLKSALDAAEDGRGE